MCKIGSAEQQPSWLLHFISFAVAMATTRPHQSQICTTEASTQSPELIEAILDGGSDFTRHPVARFRNSSPLSFEDTQEGFFFSWRRPCQSPESRSSESGSQTETEPRKQPISKINQPGLMYFKFRLNKKLARIHPSPWRLGCEIAARFSRYYVDVMETFFSSAGFQQEEKMWIATKGVTNKYLAEIWQVTPRVCVPDKEISMVYQK